MAGRQTRKKDPFQRIHSWDDGYEYIHNTTPTPPEGRNSAPFFSPPLGANRSYYEPEPPRRSKTTRGRDNDAYNNRRAYPSPPSDYSSDHDRHDRRRPRSPPPYRETRSPSPPRRRDRDRDARYPPQSTSHRPRRPSLDTYPTAPLPNRSKSTRDPSPGRHHRRNPDRDYEYTPRHRSPSPRAIPRDTARPPLSRSKTTTAAGAAAAAKERFSSLSPHWKAAAMAAVQAGGMAALQARKQPGGWNAEKGAKIATAALGAAAMGALKKDGKKSGGGGGGDAKRGGASGSGSGSGRRGSGVEGIGSALGGFLADQFAKREGKRRY